jgi:KDO2-lipid IV(A) lauroyltransferase
VEGREHLEAALTAGRGVICLTAHFGNWEIMPVFTSAQGWATAVVAQKLYDQRLDTLLNHAREAHGIRVIKRGALTREIIRALRANSLLGVLNDQDTRVDARWAPFFGRPAKTPIGLFRLARRIGSPILPMFIERHVGLGHRLVIHPALAIAWSKDEEADLTMGARLANAAIEKQIRHSPTQWVWFHQRWKSQPIPAPAAEIGGSKA